MMARNKKGGALRKACFHARNDITEIVNIYRASLIIKYNEILVYCLTYPSLYPYRLHRYRDVTVNVDQQYSLRFGYPQKDIIFRY